MPCALLLLAPVSLSLLKHQLTKGDWAGCTNSFQGHVTAITLRCSAHIRLGRMPGNVIKVTRQDYSLVSNKKKNTESYIEGRKGRKRRKRFCRVDRDRGAVTKEGLVFIYPVDRKYPSIRTRTDVDLCRMEYLYFKKEFATTLVSFCLRKDENYRPFW